MTCKECGSQTEVQFFDVERKSDGKVAENVKTDVCEDCEICYINIGGVTFE